jgi:OOP family OmpA-OmpF porin
MRTKISLLMILVFVIFISRAYGAELPDDVKKLYDSTLQIEAEIFAPKAFEKAKKAFDELGNAIDQGKKQSKIDELTAESHTYAENVFKVEQVTRLSLSEYLDPRDRAIEAKAPVLVPDLYKKAEEQFVNSTKKVEGGDVKGGLKEADKSVPLFDEAELKAIKVAIMGTAASLIDQADEDEAQNYAPTTLDKARSSLTKCDQILDKDRYNRTASIAAAHTAEYEARHASNIAQSIRAMERNDQAWEKLILLYEIEMQKVANELEMGQLPFDRGPSAASESLIVNVRTLQKKQTDMRNSLNELDSEMTEIAGRLGIEASQESPTELTSSISDALGEALSEKKALASTLESKEDKLAELEQAHEQLDSELQMRKDKEEKIKTARRLLNPTEGEVLLNSTNDIVLRLSGLSFASGASEIEEGHVDLLKKVEQILEMFPGQKIIVEGHTDDRGERSTNMRLSEKRAYAVMQYLRKTLSISADGINAVGYGPDKPVGTNTTAEGRAKNRRIDVIIMQ